MASLETFVRTQNYVYICVSRRSNGLHSRPPTTARTTSGGGDAVCGRRVWNVRPTTGPHLVFRTADFVRLIVASPA